MSDKKEIFADGIGQIHFAGGMVRYDFVTVQPAEDGKAIDLAIKALEREEGCNDISDWPSSYFQCSECENIVCDEMETKINYCPNCGRRVEQ